MEASSEDGGQMRYKQVDFVADGSLRDICVLDASVEDWQRMSSSLSHVNWEVSFSTTLQDGSADLVADIPRLFTELENDGEASATLAIQVDDIWLTCYFFEIQEIEFSFDPADVSDESSFASLTSFIEWLGDACGRRVVMTMEGTDHPSMPALLEYVPE
jgi:hypothetical protein